jgi:hypothetical protein
MSHDYDTIEEWFGSEFADADGLTYAGASYDCLKSGETTEVEYRQEGQRTTRVLTLLVRKADFSAGHPAIRATCTFGGTTFRIRGRAESSTGKTYSLTLEQQHA